MKDEKRKIVNGKNLQFELSTIVKHLETISKETSVLFSVYLAIWHIRKQIEGVCKQIPNKFTEIENSINCDQNK